MASRWRFHLFPERGFPAAGISPRCRCTRPPLQTIASIICVSSFPARPRRQALNVFVVPGPSPIKPARPFRFRRQRQCSSAARTGAALAVADVCANPLQRIVLHPLDRFKQGGPCGTGMPASIADSAAAATLARARSRRQNRSENSLGLFRGLRRAVEKVFAHTDVFVVAKRVFQFFRVIRGAEWPWRP